MTIITADIRNERAVVKALEGVDCVIHCAALIDTSLWPDVKSMNSVNVDGTQILIDASVELNVKYFIYVSSVDVVVGDDPIYFGAENTTPLPKRHILPYSKTKLDAEPLTANDYNYRLVCRTQILIDASVELNVKYFVYVSSVDVVVGDDPIYFGAENTTPLPKRHILPYSKTKLDAE
ncbi:unnamed protein product, partial [Oppiella nova]